jgi:hypothetical protein
MSLENESSERSLITLRDAILIARKDPSVDKLIRQDPHSEIYVKILNLSEIEAMTQEYPDLFPKKTDQIFSLNVISSQMYSNHGYKKIRFYLDAYGEILNRLEN